MHHHLPMEIVLDIMQRAAMEFRFASRASVVRLAMVSSATYSTVAPILYHTLIVTSKNQEALRRFTLGEHTRVAAERVCSYVRLLVHDFNIDSNLNFALFRDLETIQALGSVIGGIARASEATQSEQFGSANVTPVAGGLIGRFMARVRPSSKSHPGVRGRTALMSYAGEPVLLRCIHVWSAEFAGTLLAFPVGMRDTVLKACGYFPFFWAGHSEWQKFTSDAAGWVSSILDNLPALTHLGLILINPRPAHTEDTAVSMFDIEALVISLRTALGYSRVEMVALRVTENYIEHRGAEIENAVQQIHDPRFRLWMDRRPATSWEMWNELSNEDAMNGRDMWTEARALLPDHT